MLLSHATTIVALSVASASSLARGGEEGPCGVTCHGLAKDDSVRIARRMKFRLPRCCDRDGLSSQWMARATSANATLLKYFYPADPVKAFEHASVTRSFRAITRGCKVVADACYCIHVTGSPVKSENPYAWRASGAAVGIGNNPTLRGRNKHQATDAGSAGSASAALSERAHQLGASNEPLPGSASEIHDLFGVTPDRIERNCSCLAPKAPNARCLFSDMRPGKLLAVIAACRRLGITHIIEEGRYGGLSALIYALHGFKVTSVEMLPIDFVATGLAAAAPTTVLQVLGDGSVEVPRLVRGAPPSERIAVIFDGEKRRAAYQTYLKVRSRVHLAIFDDSYHERFPTFLDRQNETTWHTNLDAAFTTTHGPNADGAVLAPLEDMLRRAAKQLLLDRPELDAPSAASAKAQLIDGNGRLVLPPGGLQDMAHYNFVLVRGGAWRDGDELW